MARHEITLEAALELSGKHPRARQAVTDIVTAWKQKYPNSPVPLHFWLDDNGEVIVNFDKSPELSEIVASI